jgi:hypothetical protein
MLDNPQFGICGPPQKRQLLKDMTNSTAFGGYSCTATGQANSTSFKWLRSLIFTFAFQQLVWGPALIALWSVLAPRFVLFFIGDHHMRRSAAHVEPDLADDYAQTEQEVEAYRLRLGGGVRGGVDAAHVPLASATGAPVRAGDLSAALDSCTVPRPVTAAPTAVAAHKIATL